MSDQDYRLIALFFFFAFLDEKLAMQATIKAATYCESRARKLKHFDNSYFVYISRAIWNEFQSKIVKGKSTVMLEASWVVNDHVDLGSWKEFHKLADANELLSVIWSRILNIADEDIAKGLNLTIGTTRYRVGRALKKLGQIRGVNVARNNHPLGVV